jgi:Tol biopolymer transport system component
VTALRDHPQTEPDVLIEEARQRARRRRRRGAALVVAGVVAAGLVVLLTHAPAHSRAGSVSASATPGALAAPPANAIAFAKARSDGLNARIEIAYVPASGGPVVALTDAWKHKMIASYPTWSPDGSRIAFVMSPRGHLTRWAGDGDIYVINANGTDIRQLTDGLDATGPAWSPDGSRIAFIEGEGQALAVMRADGSHRHVIAHRRGYYESPAWSPDGRAIAYDSGPDWSSQAIYTIRPNGTAERQLTPSLGAAGGGPAWSPNGSRIAYTSKNELWIMNAHGTNRHPITTCPGPTRAARSTASAACLSDAGPAWSPTGGELVFEREQEHPLKHPAPTPHGEDTAFNTVRLYVLRLSTGAVRPLTPKARMATVPDWRP